MKKNIVKAKSYESALRVIKAYQYPSKEHREFVLSKQMLRSGTSVGTPVRESEYAQSKAGFIHKLSIALKEANETEYWLMLLKNSQYIDEKAFRSVSNDCTEVMKLFTSITDTFKTTNY